MRRFAYWLFPLIAGAVAVFIVVFMVQINPSAPVLESSKSGSRRDASAGSGAGEGNWLDRFSIGQDKGYSYPINEVSLKLDAGDKNPSDERYRLTVPLKDSYELFCLKQELKNSGFPYFLQKEGNAMTLLVESDDQNKLASLVTKLKTYQITATLSPCTEEK